MSLLKKLALTTAIAAVMIGGAMPAAMADNLKIALLVKNLGNGFFDAANKGAQEAAK
ncbi:MAG TPA: rhamnose ABC transporter substrate-binding protein, partial [Devosia sp.]|nr:rhamnose ABC transporter substrate-binding protein [Devosia sp.]